MEENGMMHELDDLVQKVIESDSSAFYRTMWGVEKGDAPSFPSLPYVTPEDFVQTKWRKRLYKNTKGLVKIVRNQGLPFLMQWDLSDLAVERFGVDGSERPVVMFSSGHEAIEKSLWLYERGTLPFIGETKNIRATALTAKTYGIDAILSDTDMLPRFLSELKKEYDLRKIVSISIVDSRFGIEVRALGATYARTQCILALPETGAFGENCAEAFKKDALVFHAYDDSYVEVEGENLVLTKKRLLVTPIIRYKTGIRARRGICACGKEGLSLL